MPLIDKQLENAVFLAMHKDLARRYHKKNLKRFPEYASIPEEKLALARQFFLQYIYPPLLGREHRDQAVAELRAVLKSPRKLWPFTRAALQSIGKLGRGLGPVLKVAFHCLEAYLKSIELEKLVLKETHKQKIDPIALEQPDTLRQLVSKLPVKKLAEFQQKFVAFFSSVAHPQLLHKVIETMRFCLAIMGKNSHLYSTAEVDGLKYGLSMLESAYQLSLALSAQELAMAQKAIQRVEEDWFLST